MASIITNIFIAAAVITTVFGQNYNLSSVTNGTQDYFRIAQAELLIKVKLAEMENDAIDTRFLDRLAVIELQQQQVLNETQQVNQTIIPLQALNLIRKYCIQTYDSQFLPYESVKEKLQKCMYKAQNYGNTLTSNARSYTNNARNYATNTLSRNVNNYCKLANYNNNQTKVEQCFIDYVQNAVTYVQSTLDKAEAARTQSIFDLNTISLSAVQCSFGVEKNVLEAIALTSKKIDNCINDLQNKTGKGTN